MTPRGEPSADLVEVISGVLTVVREMNRGTDLASTVQAVAEGIVKGARFRDVVVNMMRSDGMLEVVTTVGDSRMRAALQGVVFPAELMLAELMLAEQWGRLRFLPAGTVDDDNVHTWIPELPPPKGPDDWRSHDTLLAPLYGLEGELIAIISVDVPLSGKRPSGIQRQILEMLTGQAEVAITNARMARRLQASEQSFRMAFVQSAVGMALATLDESDPLRLVQANPALERLASQPISPGSHLTDLLEPEDRDVTLWADAIREARGGPHFLERRVRGMAGPRWLLLTSTALPRHVLDLPMAIVQVEDVTDVRQMESSHGAAQRADSAQERTARKAQGRRAVRDSGGV